MEKHQRFAWNPKIVSQVLMVWCSVQNWLANVVNALYPLVTWYLCDHLGSSAIDVQLEKQCVLNFCMNSENDFETGFESPCSSTCLWTCLSTTCQSVWKMDVVGVFVPVLARSSWKGRYLATGKRFHEEEGRIRFTLACYASSKIQSKKAPLEQPFWKMHPMWVEQSQLRYVSETGLSVMCSTSHVGIKWSFVLPCFTLFLCNGLKKKRFLISSPFFRVVLLSSWTQGAEGARGFMQDVASHEHTGTHRNLEWTSNSLTYRLMLREHPPSGIVLVSGPRLSESTIQTPEVCWWASHVRSQKECLHRK